MALVECHTAGNDMGMLLSSAIQSPARIPARAVGKSDALASIKTRS